LALARYDAKVQIYGQGNQAMGKPGDRTVYKHPDGWVDKPAL
jgi:hypothetical protein